jgi:hypothetical protein
MTEYTTYVSGVLILRGNDVGFVKMVNFKYRKLIKNLSKM